MTSFSLAVIGYNQERWIETAVKAALAQECAPIAIVLSDDCSADNTFEIMSRVATQYSGPHQIILNRNTERLGIGGHVRRVAELSHGEWLLLAAGDDISLPHRVAAVADIVRRDSQLRALETGIVQIDENGSKIPNAPKRQSTLLSSLSEPQTTFIFSESQRIQGCAAAWHRDVFDRFDSLSNELVYEDVFLTLRARLLGSARAVSEPDTVCYRLNGICSQYQSQSNTKLEAWYTLHFSRLAIAAELFLEDARKMSGKICDENLFTLTEEATVARKLSKWWSISDKERRAVLKTKSVADCPWLYEWCEQRLTVRSWFQMKLRLLDMKRSLGRALKKFGNRRL